MIIQPANPQTKFRNRFKFRHSPECMNQATNLRTTLMHSMTGIPLVPIIQFIRKYTIEPGSTQHLHNRKQKICLLHIPKTGNRGAILAAAGAKAMHQSPEHRDGENGVSPMIENQTTRSQAVARTLLDPSPSLTLSSVHQRLLLLRVRTILRVLRIYTWKYPVARVLLLKNAGIEIDMEGPVSS